MTLGWILAENLVEIQWSINQRYVVADVLFYFFTRVNFWLFIIEHNQEVKENNTP